MDHYNKHMQYTELYMQYIKPECINKNEMQTCVYTRKMAEKWQRKRINWN